VLVPVLLYKNIQHLAVLIDCAPQRVALSVNRDQQFVEMPRITKSPLAMPQLSRNLLPKFPTPLADHIIAHGDPTLGQKFFNVPEAEAEAVVKPYDIGNDLR
jgi:hypothetical protein